MGGVDDNSARIAEVQRLAALSVRKEVPVYVDGCLNCDAPTDGRFCDSDCRIDFEKRENFKL